MGTAIRGETVVGRHHMIEHLCDRDPALASGYHNRKNLDCNRSSQVSRGGNGKSGCIFFGGNHGLGICS